MLEHKVRFAIIGADFSLRALMAMWFPKNLAELVAVCDRNPEMLSRFDKDYGTEYPFVRKVSDFKDVLAMDNVDAVFIMVRDEYHAEMAIAALNAGKAVYLEKPMALSIEDCDAILKTAVQTKGKIFVGHNMRYVPSVLKMKEIIDSGMIGNVQSAWCRHFVNYGSCYFRHWCASQKTCNGLLLQKGAHDIDIIHWLSGGYGKRVVGMGRLSVYNRNTGKRADYLHGEAVDRKISFNDKCWPPLEIDGLRPDIDVEDSNMILFELNNGIQCSYEHSMFSPDAERNYTFIGDAGRVENVGDFGNCQIHVWTKRGPRRDPDIIYPLRGDGNGHGGSDVNILRAFFEYVKNDIPPNVSPIAARNAVAVGVMGHISARNGNMPQDIPPISQDILDYFGEK